MDNDVFLLLLYVRFYLVPSFYLRNNVEEIMKILLKSHILVSCLALCLAFGLCFMALEKDRCFEIIIYKEIRVKVGSCHSDFI